MDCLHEPVTLANGQSLTVRASVGVSAYPHDADNADDLTGHADVAMYIAKGAGKNGFHVYSRAARKTGHRDDPAVRSKPQPTSRAGPNPRRATRSSRSSNRS